jgi:general stress protein 26
MTLVSDHDDTNNPKGGADLPADQVWEMIKSIDIAMLITHSNEGLRGRPMSTIPAQEKAVIYILTEASSTAAQEIGTQAEVFLSYQGKGDHVALQGMARVNPDKGLVKDLWNAGAEAFWPQGPEEHDVVTLVIEPGHADVWDGPGILRGMASIVKGAVTGTSPDLGTRGHSDL